MTKQAVRFEGSETTFPAYVLGQWNGFADVAVDPDDVGVLLNAMKDSGFEAARHDAATATLFVTPMGSDEDAIDLAVVDGFEFGLYPLNGYAIEVA